MLDIARLVLLAVIAGCLSYLAYDTYQRREMFERFCDANAYEIKVVCASLR